MAATGRAWLHRRKGEVPPLKWSILRYGFSKEDQDGEKETYSRRDRREVAAG